MACHSIFCLLSFVLGMVFERYIDFEIERKVIQYIAPSLSEGLTTTTRRRNRKPSTEFNNNQQLETKVMCIDNHTHNHNNKNPRMHWEQRYVNPMFISDSSSFQFDWANKTKLQNRWIYLVGDSSLRMFLRGLIHVIEPTFADPHFGSYLIHDKGGCVSEEDGHAGGGCLREYFNRDMQLRITFSFKTFADQPSLAMSWLISESQQPDIIVGATGAWDVYFKKMDLDKSVGWFRGLANTYSTSLILAMTLVSCPPFRAIVTEHNKMLAEALLKENLGNLAVLDRQASTEPVQDAAVCEGFHAYGSLTLLHVHEFLANIQIMREK